MGGQNGLLSAPTHDLATPHCAAAAADAAASSSGQGLIWYSDTAASALTYHPKRETATSILKLTAN